MIKSLLGCALAVLFTTAAWAQDAELFPELKGRFQPAPKAQTTKKTTSDTDLIVVDFGASTSPAQDSDSVSATAQPADAVQSGAVSPEEVTGPVGEGNVVIRLDNVKGTLALARNYSFCSADAVLTNDTNMTLESLSMTLVYKGSPNELSFSNVKKKGTQTQKIMMIGPECEGILAAPEINISECKLGKQTEDACKKRIQFTPPNS